VPTALLELAWVGLAVAQAVVLGRQDAIEFFYQDEKFMPVFLDRDKGAQFLNAITISFIHEEKPAAIKPSLGDSVCSTSNNRGRSRVTKN